MAPRVLRARALNPALYRPYGEVIAARGRSAPANLGTARRFDFLARLVSRRRGARANLCLFRCSPWRAPATLRLLERHPESTQVFLPLSSTARYLVVVARGARAPDPRTLAAFVVEGPRGVTYRPGVWHHPLIALGRRTDFACLVWEDGSSRDCEESRLETPLRVRP